MRYLLYLPLLLLLSVSCKKKDNDEEPPACLNSLIDSYKATACSTGASVKEYTFQGNQVYVFEPGNCGADMQSPVYNNSCGSMGALGGISGNIMINGADFASATYVKTVWQN